MDEAVRDEPVKKGKPSWKPAHILDTVPSHPTHRLRWCAGDEGNLHKKQKEGWVFANKVTGVDADFIETHGQTKGARTQRELVLMGMPKELAEERTRYFDRKTDESERGLKKRLERDMSGGDAKPHGKIVID